MRRSIIRAAGSQALKFAAAATCLGSVVAVAILRAPSTGEAALLAALAVAGFAIAGSAVATVRRSAIGVRDAVDALADGIVVYDENDRVAFANRRYRELHPDNPAAVEPGTRFEDAFRAGLQRGEVSLDDTTEERLVERRLALHRAAADSFEQQSGDRWLRISERRTASGRIVGIHTDITDVRSARAAAERAEQLLYDAIDNMTDGFVIYDRDDRLVICNNRYRDLYPRTASALVPGALFQDVLRLGLAAREYPDAIGREDEWFQERLERHRAPEAMFEQRLADGRWVLVIERRLHDGAVAGMRVDITELKAAQAAAEWAQARMADFAWASTDWLWESDADGRITYVSEGFEAATGIPAAQRLGDRRLDLNREVDPGNPGFDDHLATVAAMKPFRDFVYTIQTRFGPRHYSSSGKPFFDELGRLLGYRGTARHVTPQVTAERALQEANVRLQQQADVFSTLIENLPLGVCLVGPDQRFQAFNQTYAQMFGLPGDFLQIGDPLEKLIRQRPDRSRLSEREMDAVIRAELPAPDQEGAQQFEEIRHTGKIVEVRRVALADGGHVTIRIDATERHRREQEIEQANRRLEEQAEVLRSLIDNAPVGVILVDAALRFTAFNDKLLSLFGLERDALRPGDSFETFLRMLAARGEFGADEPEAAAAQALARAKTRAVHPVSAERTRPNGQVIEIRSVPLPDGGFVASYIDVTAARTREAELEDARATLQRQADDLQAANAAKTLFLANMSHELRTPLNAIIGFSEIMASGPAARIDDKFREYANDIHTSGHYLLKLISDVLDLSKAEFGELHLQHELIGLAVLFDECRRLMIDRAVAGRLTLEMAAPPSLIVHADRVRTKQILLNLLSNAIKFTPPGGQVRATAYAAGGGVVIEVADTGIGMRPEDVPRALETFRQLENVYARRHEGTGLGLPLAKRLAELHAGRLTIETALGAGTTVKVWLPGSQVNEVLDASTG